VGVMAAAPAASFAAQAAQSQAPARAGGEASLVLPDLGSVNFLGDAVSGRVLLMSGLFICGLGLLFGLVTYSQH